MKWRACVLLVLSMLMVGGLTPSALAQAGFRSELKGKHPRLLMTPETLPKLQQFYESEEGALWREQLEKYLPACTPPTDEKFLTDATDGQRQGFWKLPTVALHYKLTGDGKSRDNTIAFLEKLESMEHWETGPELDSGMSAGNIMIGAALAYDWLYDDLEPAFRDKMRAKLKLHARRMYEGGHQKGNPGLHYWQNDPANNHRWHRNAGMALCTLAAYEGESGEDSVLPELIKELEYIAEWLPDDGTSHEGPGYLTFGMNHLVLAFQAADECLGMDLLQRPFFKHVGAFRVGTLLPGFTKSFGFGDWDGDGLGHYSNYLFKTAAVHKQPEIRDAAVRLYKNSPSAFAYSWFTILWDDPALKGGDATKLPLANFWPDIGVMVVRESWEDGAPAALFKCGPFGGYRLNQFSKANGNSYINVAHDDPDANSFVLARGGEFLAETDRYAKAKQSASHNTILINGAGQMSEGREEGGVWSQPTGDMTKMGIISAQRATPEVVVVEGEAAGSYLSHKGKGGHGPRPDLDRFRRMFVWVKGQYVLVLDEVKAPSAVHISWLMQGPQLSAANQEAGEFLLASATQKCPFSLWSPAKLDHKIGKSPADSRGKSLGFQQLTASPTEKVSSLYVASVYDLWNRGGLKIAGNKAGEVAIKGSDFMDVWSWKPGTTGKGSALAGKRQQGAAGGSGLPFSMSPSQSVPPME